MGDDWEEATLGEEVDLLTGFPFRSDRYTDADDSIRLVRGDNIVQGAMRWDGVKKWPASEAAAHASYQLREGDVVLAMDRPWIEAGLKYATLSKHDLPCLLVQRTARLRGGPRLETRYLRYLIGSPEFTQHVHAITTGTAVPHISARQIGEFKFQRPSLDEQRAIAHILGTLDDKIDLNRRMNETLEAMARALFKSWFVDFDPVRAKAEGRDPGLPRPLADLFPDSFEDSELGEIPRGWAVGPILDHARLMSGGTPKTTEPGYWDGPIAWASAKDVSQSAGSILVSTERTITTRGLEESATQMIPALCSVVVARGATTGRMVLFGRDMAMNQTCYALSTTTGTPFALYCRLRKEIDGLVHAAHGSVFDTITTSTFASSRVVLPPRPLLVAFEERIGPFFQRVLESILEAGTLAALRDALLPKLVSGDLRVEDPARFVGGGA
jgi:type I restriction enzyme S subunit